MLTGTWVLSCTEEAVQLEAALCGEEADRREVASDKPVPVPSLDQWSAILVLPQECLVQDGEDIVDLVAPRFSAWDSPAIAVRVVLADKLVWRLHLRHGVAKSDVQEP